MSLMLLAALLTTDARPTAADVATAVQLSKAQYTQRHSPISRDQISERVARQKMATVVRSLTSTQNLTNDADRSAAVKTASVELERLRHEVADVLSRRQAVPPGTELDAIDISGLSVGHVGQLRCCNDHDGFTARCEQVLGPDKSIVRITRHRLMTTRLAGAPPDRMIFEQRSIPSVSATVILKGYPTQKMHAGEGIQDLNVSLVTVGREFLGRTLPVLEVFDPATPFK